MTLHHPSDASTFGDLLRQHRRTRALTQEALAERAGVSARAISDLERGVRTHPYRETATQLANALGLTGGERAGFLAVASRRIGATREASRAGRAANLPVPLTRLIGRGEELAEIAHVLLADRQRLLTLVGPAGVGKTRLAVEVAASVADAFRDGVVFIDLAPLQQPSLVLPAIAAGLGLREGAGAPLETVRRALATRQMLLLLDNFEHLLEAAPLVSDLLQTGAGVQMIVTSRAALRLRGEWECPVTPLPAPDPDSVAAEEIAGWAAIALFLERARAARPEFRLTAENAVDVAAICHRLDGLPLALELAAPRLKILSPAMLLERLAKRPPLLTGGPRDAPGRQQTLQAAIAWSYDLLAPAEQALLRSLAVFVGGWTLEAAEAVGSQCGVPDVFTSLDALFAQSLIARDDRGPEPRYRMLETVREFASEWLDALEEGERARWAHLAYLLRFAEENDLEPLDATVDQRLRRLQSEEANLRAGIEWALAHDPDAAQALLARLGYYWFLVDRPATGCDLHERVLLTDASADTRDRARVLQQLAWLVSYVGNFSPAEPIAERALALAERLGDGRTVAQAEVCLGGIAMSRGEFTRARSLLEDALARFEALGDVWGMLKGMTELGLAAQDWGDVPAAAQSFERVRDLVTEYRLPSLYRAHALVNLGAVYRLLGRHEDAVVATEEALALSRAGEKRSTAAVAQQTLGQLLLDRGEITFAAPLVAGSVAYFWEIGDTWSLTQALEAAAEVLMAAHPAAAVSLFAAAAALREAMPYPLGVAERGAQARQLQEIRATLGEAAFARAWDTGQAQSVDDVVAEARAALAAVDEAVVPPTT